MLQVRYRETHILWQRFQHNMVSHWYGTSLIGFTSFCPLSTHISFLFLAGLFFFWGGGGYFSLKQNLKMISWLAGHPREQHRSTFVSEQDEFASQYYPKEREVKMQVVRCLFPKSWCAFLAAQRVGAILPADFCTLLIRANPGKKLQ